MPRKVEQPDAEQMLRDLTDMRGSVQAMRVKNQADEEAIEALSTQVQLMRQQVARLLDRGEFE